MYTSKYCVNCHIEMPESGTCSQCGGFITTPVTASKNSPIIPLCYGCGEPATHRIEGEDVFPADEHTEEYTVHYVEYWCNKCYEGI